MTAVCLGSLSAAVSVLMMSAQTGPTKIPLTGAVLFLDGNSGARVVHNRVEVLNGSAILVVDRGANASVSCEDEVKLSAGIYRFDLHDSDCRLRVYAGEANAQLATVTAALRRGDSIRLNRRCGDMISTQPFDLGERDEFDRATAPR